MNRKLLKASTLTLALCLAASTAFAFQGEGRGGNRSGQGRKGNPIEKRLMRQGKMVLRHGDQIGLTEDQKSQVRTLLTDTQKEQIKQKAEIQLIRVDLKVLMFDDPIDVQAVNPLIDQKHDLQKTKEKSLIQAYAKFQEILTDEQKSQLQDLRNQFREDRKQGQGRGQGKGQRQGRGQGRGNFADLE